ERGADDLRQPARVARAVVHRHVRRRDDQRALRPRPHDPRRRKRAARRPDVRVARRHRDPRLCRRPAGALRPFATPRLAAAGMSRLLPFVFVGVVLAIWEAVARSGLWSPLLFPSLEKIGRELVLFFSRPESLMEAWVSLERAMGGFALAALLDPLFSGTYAVPKLALFPIFIFVFGIGSLSKVALVFLECLYPIVIMT